MSLQLVEKKKMGDDPNKTTHFSYEILLKTRP